MGNEKKDKIEDLLEEAVEELLENVDDDSPLKKEFADAKKGDDQKDSGDANDGLLAIKKGVLELTPPKSSGRWPKIEPGENVLVKVKVKGKEINVATVVTDVSEVEINVKDKPPYSNFELYLSQDQVELILETQFTPGEKFYLKDVEPDHLIVVEARFLDELPPPPLDENKILEKAIQMGVDETKVSIFHQELKKAATSLNPGKTVIATGKPVEPPVDGWIEYMFSTEERIKEATEERDRVDLFDKGEFNSVEAGETLAVYHSHIEGSEGITVTGEVIKPPQPEMPEIRVGKGAKLIDDGWTAVSTIAGRPNLCKNNRIFVVPELVIAQNVDINTGHIYFKGDVKIYGDVKDGLEVNAGGYVHVFGSVFNGEILGDKGVTINNNLINGFVSAGGRSAQYRKLLPHVKRLEEILDSTVEAFQQLSKDSNFSGKNLKRMETGKLIKQFLESKFPKLEQIIKELENSLPAEYEGEEQILRKVMSHINSRLTGHGPLKIKSINELKNIRIFLSRVYQIIQDNIEEEASVVVKGGQNAHIEATGQVKVTGAGIYHSNIFAGNVIEVSGFCRGGKLYAIEKIVAGELGSYTGVKTRVEVEEHGKIIANTVYPEVTARLGPNLRKNNEIQKNVVLSEEKKPD